MRARKTKLFQPRRLIRDGETWQVHSHTHKLISFSFLILSLLLFVIGWIVLSGEATVRTRMGFRFSGPVAGLSILLPGALMLGFGAFAWFGAVKAGIVDRSDNFTHVSITGKKTAMHHRDIAAAELRPDALVVTDKNGVTAKIAIGWVYPKNLLNYLHHEARRRDSKVEKLPPAYALEEHIRRREKATGTGSEG